MNCAQFNRRNFTTLLGVSAFSAVQSCSKSYQKNNLDDQNNDFPQYRSEILAIEKARPKSGRRTYLTIEPQVQEIDLGGPIVSSPIYDSTIPGTVLRAQVGDVISATVRNSLPFPTNVHWHGLSIRNDADFTTSFNNPLLPQKQQSIEFTVTEPGTYWVHPHHYMDTDYGMYAPLIIDDVHEPHDYDAEWIVVLDDWSQGIGPDPMQIFGGLKAYGTFDARRIYSPNQAKGVETPGLIRTDVKSMATVDPHNHKDEMGNMDDMPGMGGMSNMPHMYMPDQRFHAITFRTDSRSFIGDIGDVQYPYFLINGRIPAAPSSFHAKPGQRIRIRMINASADTAYTVALADHAMAITHTDGFAITPTSVDAVILGMGERYDVVVTTKSGIFPLVARAEGKNDIARALLHTAPAQIPDISLRPAELDGRKFFVSQLLGLHRAQDLGLTKVDAIKDIVFDGTMMPYTWSINSASWPNIKPTIVAEHAVVQLNFINKTSMWHPVHLHGHRMFIRGRNDSLVNKDTVMVPPQAVVSAKIKTDNPGGWLIHCHNAYHMDAGMMSRLDYIL